MCGDGFHAGPPPGRNAISPLLNYWKPYRVLLKAGYLGREMKRQLTLTINRAGALALAAALLLPVTAQAQSPGDGVSNFLNNLFNKPGGNSPPQAATGSTGPQPWSGEDGASGHPLMTASAIREAAANFDSCVAGMSQAWPPRRG